MEILQLKYFQHAARSENISHTAHMFMVPPSSVSSSIKKLEAELGVKLFDRGANSLKLNENGKIFLRAVDVCDKELRKAKTDILNLSELPNGEIRLLILTNRSRVTDAIASFKAEYPGVAFSISHDDYGDFKNYGHFDIIVSDRDITNDLFDRVEYVREEIYLAVHKDSALANLKNISAKNLNDEKFISMPKGSSIRDFMDNLFERAGCEPDIAIECDDPHFVSKYLKMGLGVAIFPSVSWEKNIDDSIHLVRIDNGVYRHSYMYVNKSSTNVVKLFADKLVTE